MIVLLEYLTTLLKYFEYLQAKKNMKLRMPYTIQ